MSVYCDHCSLPFDGDRRPSATISMGWCVFMDTKIFAFAGKGGVGKTTLAAAMILKVLFNDPGDGGVQISGAMVFFTVPLAELFRQVGAPLSH